MTRIAIVARFTSFIALRCSYLGAMFLILLVNGVNAQTVSRRTTDGPTPSGLAPGVSGGSYALSGFDTINLATGSLYCALPLLTISGRGTAQYTMMLPIERHWSIKSEGHYYSCYGSQICFSWDHSYPDSSLGDKAMPGYGPGVMQGRQTGIFSTTCSNTSQGYSTTLTVLTFTTPDGSAIEFRDTAHNGQQLPATPCGNITEQGSRGTVFTSADGSAMTFISDLEIRDYWQYRTLAPTGYLIMRD